MTASTVKSTSVSGFDSIPVTLQQGSRNGTANRTYMDNTAIATTSLDDIGDIVKLVRIPSHLRITAITVSNDALDTNGTPLLQVKWGLFNSSTGSAASDNCFSSSSTVLRAAAFKTDIFKPTSTLLGKMAWEIAGLSADPGVPLDVAYTVTAVAGTAATGQLFTHVSGTLDN